MIVDSDCLGQQAALAPRARARQRRGRPKPFGPGPGPTVTGLRLTEVAAQALSMTVRAEALPRRVTVRSNQ